MTRSRNARQAATSAAWYDGSHPVITTSRCVAQEGGGVLAGGAAPLPGPPGGQFGCMVYTKPLCVGAGAASMSVNRRRRVCWLPEATVTYAVFGPGA
jgi:hypothetical protein